jgi:ketosteroid isomerase-like protein
MNEQSSKFENPAELEQIISAWNQHVNETDWQTVIEGMSPDMGEDGSKQKGSKVMQQLLTCVMSK